MRKYLLFALVVLMTIAPVGASVQAAIFDVALTRTLLTMPGNGFFVNNDVPLIGARWVEGNFVISSSCSGGDNSKGLWVFNEAGSQIGQRDTCKDAGENSSASAPHTWSTVPNTQPVGGGQFVKEMGPYNDRPPLLYRVSGNSLSLVSKPWTGPGLGGNAGTGITSVDNLAAIPGFAVTVGFESNSKNYSNVLYRLPNWTVLQRSSATFIPITGVGNYIVGTPTPGNSGLALYKVVNDNLQMVGSVTQTSARPVAAAVDSASNGTKVGILFINDGRFGNNYVNVYTVSENGLSFNKKVTLPATATYSSAGWQSVLAVSGDYTAFLDCGLPAIPFPPNGARDFFNTANCGLAVLRGTTRLNVERLPYATTKSNPSVPITQTLPPEITGIAMSPGGSIVAVSSYGAYLYKVGGTSQGPIPDPNDPFPPGSATTTLPQIPGQTFNITHSTSTPAAPPAVLIRFANVISVNAAAKSMAISIFGHNYNVDASRAEIVNSSWGATSITDFTLTPFANVWGTLDPANGTLIHAVRVRNPIPMNAAMRTAIETSTAPVGSFSADLGAGTSFGSGPAVSNPVTQTKLDALEEALKALQRQLEP